MKFDIADRDFIHPCQIALRRFAFAGAFLRLLRELARANLVR